MSRPALPPDKVQVQELTRENHELRRKLQERGAKTSAPFCWQCDKARASADGLLIHCTQWDTYVPRRGFCWMGSNYVR